MNRKDKTSFIPRRKFIQTVSTGSAMLLSVPFVSFAFDLTKGLAPVTVGQIIDAFIQEVPEGAIPNTVDTLKSGNREQVVKGVVTCMFATVEVIKKAAALGANFIIAHEPTFYNHQDAIAWLENDTVFKYKLALLAKHNIAVWRNHDYIHSVHPDGVRKALVEELGWQKFGSPDQSIYTFNSPVLLSNLIGDLKKKLGIPALRYHGDLNQSCAKILLMPGAAGGKSQIESLMKYKPDVLVTGEISEWETAEYVRDAQESGQKIALVILGHIASEEPGSKFMLAWMLKHFPQIKTTFIKTSPSLSVR